MAEGQDQDKASKTEEPTLKKLEDARKKGQVATSKEVNTLFLFGGALLLLYAVVPWASADLAQVMAGFLSNSAGVDVATPAGIEQLFATTLKALWGFLGWPALAFVVAVLASFAVQGSVVWTPEPLKPKLERISLIAGFKRLFSAKSLVEMLKNLLKISVVGAAIVGLLWFERARLIGSGLLEIAPMTAYLKDLSFQVLGVAFAVTLVFAMADFAWQKHSQHQEMRMSRKEVQDEQKQSDGDPMIKGRQRQLRQERLRQTVAEVSKATVVVTNPTHYSVALRYVPGDTPVPVVVAKGADHLALAIRRAAKEHGVPVTESPPLARALYATAKIGEPIPEKLYQAVAELIGYLLRIKKLKR